MRTFHILFVILLAVGCVLLGSEDISLAISRAEILNVAKYNVMTSADPHTSTYNDMSMYIDGNIFEGLVTISKDDFTKVEPVLATSWEVSPDGLAYTFNLRKGVKFSDGTPFNGQAVKFNFDRLLALKKGGSYLGFKVIKNVEVLDEYKVRFTLKQNFPFLAVTRYSFMVSPKAVKEHATPKDKWAQNWLANHSAGTAPYMIKDWVHEVNITLVQNPHYWRGWRKNNFKVINIRSMYEADVQRMLLEKGDLDIAMIISRDALPALKKNREIWAAQNITPAPMMLLFNFLVPPTNDIRVRKALAHAWNHEAYKEVRRGVAPRADGPIPAVLLGKDYRLENPYVYDPDKARDLLKQAGYPKGGFTLNVLSQKGDEQKRMIFEVFQSEVAKLGVKLNYHEKTWAGMTETCRDRTLMSDPKNAMHIVILYKSMDVVSPWNYLYKVYSCETQMSKPTGVVNLAYYCNPRVDEIIKRALATVDREKALELWRQGNQIVMDDCAAVFVDKQVEDVVMRASVKGYNPRVFTPRQFYYYELYRE